MGKIVMPLSGRMHTTPVKSSLGDGNVWQIMIAAMIIPDSACDAAHCPSINHDIPTPTPGA
jgi:hypothetical protein